MTFALRNLVKRLELHRQIKRHLFACRELQLQLVANQNFQALQPLPEFPSTPAALFENFSLLACKSFCTCFIKSPAASTPQSASATRVHNNSLQFFHACRCFRLAGRRHDVAVHLPQCAVIQFVQLGQHRVHLWPTIRHVKFELPSGCR